MHEVVLPELCILGIFPNDLTWVLALGVSSWLCSCQENLLTTVTILVVCDNVVFLFLLLFGSHNLQRNSPSLQEHFKLLASIQWKQNTEKSNLFIFFLLLVLSHLA